MHCIITLWDHHRICGLLLTKMSLCGAYLYNLHLSPLWQQFKICHIKNQALAFTAIHNYHSTSIPSVTSQLTAWFIKISSSTSFSVHISPCCARLTGVIISMGVHLTTVNSLQHFMTQCSLTPLSSHTCINWQRILMCWNVFHPRESNHTTDVFVGPSFQYYYHGTATYPMNSSWMTDSSTSATRTSLIIHTTPLPLVAEPDAEKWLRCVDQKGYTIS
jgi:hypothetical protein